MPKTHTVGIGDGLDSLWKIAKHYGVSFAEIKKLNPEIMTRFPPGDSRHGWIHPGDVIKLPPKLEREEETVRKTTEDCNEKQPLEVIAVALKTEFRLCEPAMFQVTSYKGKPTEADKGRIKWMIRDAKDKSDLSTATGTKITQKKDKLIIDCVPFDWRGRKIEVAAQFDKTPQKKMVEHQPQSAEVYDWIATIIKAEAAYPKWTGVQMTNAMRRLAGYDGGNFRTMYGGSPAGAALTPAGALSAADIKQLEAWTKHTSASTGLVKDSNGESFAAGHVLTGISGGVYRDTSVDVAVSWLPFGEKMDNLYAVTISGDLGQAAVFVNEGKQKKPYIGSHGDADDAEILGDLDASFSVHASPRATAERSSVRPSWSTTARARRRRRSDSGWRCSRGSARRT